MTTTIDVSCETCGRTFASPTQTEFSGSEYENGRDTPYDAPTEIHCDFCRGEATCCYESVIPSDPPGTPELKRVPCSRRATIRLEDDDYCTTHGVQILAEEWRHGSVGFPIYNDPDGKERMDVAPGEVVA